MTSTDSFDTIIPLEVDNSVFTDCKSGDNIIVTLDGEEFDLTLKNKGDDFYCETKNFAIFDSEIMLNSAVYAAGQHTIGVKKRIKKTLPEDALPKFLQFGAKEELIFEADNGITITDNEPYTFENEIELICGELYQVVIAYVTDNQEQTKSFFGRCAEDDSVLIAGALFIYPDTIEKAQQDGNSATFTHLKIYHVIRQTSQIQLSDINLDVFTYEKDANTPVDINNVQSQSLITLINDLYLFIGHLGSQIACLQEALNNANIEIPDPSSPGVDFLISSTFPEASNKMGK